jgi:pimeloyl-ACP methyl ester carboxylesterase
MKHIRLFLQMMMLALIVIFISCGKSTPMVQEPTLPPLTDTPVPTEEPPKPAGTPVSFGKVDVGGYGLYLMCKGEESPTIVMEYGVYYEGWSFGGSGYGTYSQYDNLKNILAAQMQNRACTYVHAGNMLSDPAPDTPRTSQDFMEELHNLLVNGNIPGPYILVAGGSASFHALLYADQHPDEIAGLVLISPMHPDEVASIASITDEATGYSEGMKRIKQFYTTMLQDPANTPGDWDYQTSLEQVRMVETLGDLLLLLWSTALITFYHSEKYIAIFMVMISLIMSSKISARKLFH